MPPMRCLLSALALSLAACGAQESPSPATATATPAAATAPQTGTAGHAPHVRTACRGATLVLTALHEGDGLPQRTRLEAERDGRRTVLDVPQGMQDVAAIGLGCTRDASGTPYFVVQYGELPRGCAACEWFVLHDADGRPLHAAAASLREDGQAPDNDAYERRLRELGLAHPEIALLPF
ncbi:hypothetical protein LDO32_00625 [Luteimonas sp. Y-2-2-4F]|nr:hypothetical protein [Luteimonas sp. Y-2-2-4F]MCD9030240.1 hypothetical protein [Luteimonas sp. Y-2-2-4F]